MNDVPAGGRQPRPAAKAASNPAPSSTSPTSTSPASPSPTSTASSGIAPSSAVPTQQAAAPGQDNNAVYGTLLGKSTDEIDHLRAEGVL